MRLLALTLASIIAGALLPLPLSFAQPNQSVWPTPGPANGLLTIPPGGFQKPVCDYYPDPKSLQNKPEGQKLVDQTVEWLSQHTRPLGRDIYVYHWTHRSALGPQSNNAQPEGARAYLKARLSEGDSATPPCKAMSAAVGPGLYVAIDPHATAEYGGQDPALFEIQIPAWTKVVRETDDTAPPELEAALRKECQISSQSGFRRFFAAVFRSPNCRWLTKKVLDRLHAGMIEYRYSASSYRSCGSDIRTSSFALIAPSLEKESWNLIIPKNAKEKQPPSRSEAEQRFENFRNMVFLSQDNQGEEFASWIWANLYQCGNHFEDTAPEMLPQLATKYRERLLSYAQALLADGAVLQKIKDYTYQERSKNVYDYQLRPMQFPSFAQELGRMDVCNGLLPRGRTSREQAQCVMIEPADQKQMNAERLSCRLQMEAGLALLQQEPAASILKDLDALLARLIDRVKKPNLVELFDELTKKTRELLEKSESDARWIIAEKAYSRFASIVRRGNAEYSSIMPLETFRAEYGKLRPVQDPIDRQNFENLVRGVLVTYSDPSTVNPIQNSSVDELLDFSLAQLEERASRQQLKRLRKVARCLEKVKRSFLKSRSFAKENACAFLR